MSLLEELRQVEEAFATAVEADLTGDYRVVDVFRRDGGAWTLAWRIAHRLTES